MTDHPVPARKRPTFRRTCSECGSEFTTQTHDRMFCSDAHKAAFHNRSSKIGRAVVPLAMAWRAGRNAKGKSAEARALRASAARAMSEMVRLLDAAVTDDREQGRSPKLEYLRRRWAAEGTLQQAERVSYHREQDEKAVARKAAAAPAKA